MPIGATSAGIIRIAMLERSRIDIIPRRLPKKISKKRRADNFSGLCTSTVSKFPFLSQ